MEHSRDNLIAMGVRLRSAEGPGALAQRILPRLCGRDVVDSIRHPGEVEVLRTLPRFLLLGLNAPLPLRFARSVSRARLGDGVTLEEFSRQEARENSDSAAGQQLESTLRLADICITNNGTIADLAAGLAAALGPLWTAVPSEPV